MSNAPTTLETRPAAGAPAAGAPATHPADETAIRAMLEDWLAAVRERDLDRICAHYDPEVVAYDAITHLRLSGVDAYRRHWQDCLAMCDGPMNFRFRDLTIAACGDVAFGHALVDCGGTGPDGKEESHWTRMSAGYRKREGGWRIVHEHFSAPFDVQTMKVLYLAPQEAELRHPPSGR